jgi:hypothetical protein
LVYKILAPKQTQLANVDEHATPGRLKAFH